MRGAGVITKGTARFGAIAGGACLVLAGALPSQAATSLGWRVVARFASPHASVQFNSVTALSARDAWAVGTVQGTGPGSPVVVHWNGSTWRTFSLPRSVRTALGTGFIFGLEASSASNVWFSGQRGWARWTGHGWQTGKLPVARRGESSQSGQLLVFGPHNVWLIGSYTAHMRVSAFARRYDGSHWRVMPAPGFTNFVLSASSPSAICAVNGLFGSPTGTTQLACWNGSRWQPQWLPTSLNHQHAIIGGILARSHSDIWVGGSAGGRGVAAHWNGHRWHVQTLPAVSFGIDVLSQLTSDGHGGMWAIGVCDCGGPAWGLWHYTGGRWTAAVHLPAAIGGTFGLIRAIAAVPGTASTWAVGARGTATGSDGVVLVNGRKPR
jgi:hypothetical protein